MLRKFDRVLKLKGSISQSLKERGSLMVEALAMLALISMVTPMVYKKAAERTTELQDINAASQIRIIVNSIDNYLKDNYVDITRGQAISAGDASEGRDCGNPVTYNFDGNGNKEVEMRHFCDYLPYGFFKDSSSSKIFEDFDVIIKKQEVGGKDSLTALILAHPHAGQVNRMRGSRIASMIGSNGGTAEGTDASGTQGVWAIDLKKFGLNDEQPIGTIAATSVQSVATSAVGGDDVLYRKAYDDPELNTMATTLLMGGNDIEDINKMIVTGEDTKAVDVKGGILVAKDSTFSNLLTMGTAKVGLNAVDPKDNGLSVQGATDVGGSLIVGAKTELKGGLDVGTATASADSNLYGSLTVSGSATLNDGLTVNKTVATMNAGLTVGTTAVSADSNLHGSLTVDAKAELKGGLDVGTTAVSADSKLYGTLTVSETSDLTGKVTIGPSTTTTEQVLQVQGASTFEGLISANAGIDALELYGEDILAGGLISRSENSRLYNFLAKNDSVTVKKGFQAGKYNAKGDVDKGNYNLSVSGEAVDIREGYLRVDGSNATEAKRNVQIGGTNTDDANLYINNGIVTTRGKFYVDGKDDKKEIHLLEVGTEQAGNIDSIRIRKGILEIAPPGEKEKDIGYIKAERLVDNKTYNGFSKLPVPGKEDWKDQYWGMEYQVNPAYTSVMHDIKLTTRGGARLSDILPDFINKGIYVLDNTYDEYGCGGAMCNWETVNMFTDITKKTDKGRIGASECTAGSFECNASPWLGFIPAPQCPPGYSKVATITPIRWAMAQAGAPYDTVDRKQKKIKDVYMYKYPDVKTATSEPPSLTFQKNTWLNTIWRAHCGTTSPYECSGGKGNKLQGWSGIMGFIYPYIHYKKYLGPEAQGGIGLFDSDPQNKESLVVWNVFPVKNQELTAIANVYCYFDRSSFTTIDASTGKPKSIDLIDTTYNQMDDMRSDMTKDDTYEKRLNDPHLTYNNKGDNKGDDNIW